MKQEIAQAWVAALRSGKYRQSKGRLKGEAGFCCLGVLCEISGLDKWTAQRLNGNVICYSYASARSTLPGLVGEWAGMLSPNGTISGTDCRTLAKCNDGGASFEEIAGMIEEHWRSLSRRKSQKPGSPRSGAASTSRASGRFGATMLTAASASCAKSASWVSG